MLCFSQNRGLNLTSDSEMMLLNDGGNPDTIGLKLRVVEQIGNTAELIPSGTTGTRPTGFPGYFRHNKTTGRYEGVVSGTTWVNFLTSADGSVAGGGAANRLAFWSDASTLSSSGNLTWDGTIHGITGRQTIVGTASYSTDQNFLGISGTATTTANGVDISGINSTIVAANDGTPTSNSFRGGTFGLTTNTTTSGILYGLVLGGTNTSPNTTQFYGMSARLDENSASGSLSNRYGMDFLIVKGALDGADAHTATGFRARLQESTSTGRWTTAIGASLGVENAVTGTGAVINVSNSKGTNATQFGMTITNTASGSGVTVANAYGIRFIPTETSSGSITNNYCLFNNTAPVATNSWFLYNSQNYRNYLNGNLAIGADLQTAKLTVRGAGNTSSTYSAIFEDSDGDRVVVIRDDELVGVGTSTPSTKLHIETVTGTTTPILRIENTGGSADFFVANTSPEGSITASPGSLALRTDTGNGKLYVKGSGTGNTGWVELGAGGATDHGALTGLSDDDHSQYLLLAGRATGQVATGGTASGDDLTLRSTTDATKGDVILNDQGGNVILGGGELSGELRFMEPGGSGSNYTGFKSGAMGANQMYTLPTDAPSDGDVMTWGTGNVLSWEPVGGGANYQTWREDGAAATVQPNANFVTTSTIEPTLTNDAGNSETEVSMSIVVGSVNSTHLNQMGAVAGQVLTWDGAAWNPAYVTDDIYPADITVDVNDYEPTGWATSTEVFVSSSAIWTITGFDALVGQVRTVINDGDFPFVIACHHTGSAAANRVFGREDLIVLPGDAVTLTYNNNIGRWYVKSNTFYPQKLGTVWNGIYYYQQPGSTNQSDHPFLGLATSGTGTSNANAVPGAEQPNHWEASTGSTAAGIATIYLPKNANNFARTGDGHIEVQANVFVPTLSTSAQRYTLQVGMIPNANTTTLAVNNSVFVRYKDDVNDGEFELVTRNNAGTETAVDCNVAVAANTPYQITVVLNESRTEARAYINGTLAAINTSTMPNAAVNVGARVGIFKSVGTTARFAKIGSIVGFVVL